MRITRSTRLLSTALLTFGLTAAAAAPAAADSTPTPRAAEDAPGPPRAGTAFRTPTVIVQGRTAP
ncbi:hypothetical protein ACFWUX_33780, partial [Streptomyces sp. NPDC058625]